MKNCTDITIVLDRSGSMNSVREDVIGGINSFLKDQDDDHGPVTVTLTQFDTHYQIDYSGVPIKDVPMLDTSTYVPRGGTALYDAIGRTINGVGERLAKLPESERPSKVIFVVYTDGADNASREFKKSQIYDMIKHQQEKYNWQMLFLGADISVNVGKEIGFADDMSYSVSKLMTFDNCSKVSVATKNYRSGVSAKLSYDANQQA